MPVIRPVSDLRNYNTILKDVSYGNPVYLTKNGHGDYAIISMKELDELMALRNLCNELNIGESSAKEKGFMSIEESRKKLGI